MDTPQRLLCALSLTAALGCSADDADDLELRDAKVSWDATSRALTEARVELEQRVPNHYDGTLRIDCEQGGALNVVRQREQDGEFQLDAAFDACAHDGLVIDGELSLVTSVAIDVDDEVDLRDGSLAVLVGYSGWLELSGSVDGLCVVDAQLRVGAATIDHHFTIGAAVSGTLCGHDAADVVSDEAQD